MIERLRRRVDLLRGDYRRWGLDGVVRRLSWAGVLPRDLFCATQIEILKLRRLNTNAIGRGLQGYDLRMLDERDMSALVSCGRDEAPPESIHLFRRFFAEGGSCVGAFHHGRLIGYCWAFTGEYVITFDNYEAKNITLTLAEHDVMFANGLIEEAHRLKGIFPHLLSFLMAHLSEHPNVYAWVDSLNDRSLLSHYRLGFVSEGAIRYLSGPFGERISIKPAGACRWREGGREMYLRDVCARARSSRILRTPIVEPAIGNAIKEFLETVGNVSFTQTLGWLSSFGAGTGAFLFVTFDADRIVACSIVTEQKIQWLGKSIYRIQHGPSYANETGLRQHVSDLATALDRSALWVEVSPCVPGDRRTTVSALLQSCGFVPPRDEADLVPSTLVLNLEQTTDELRAAMTETARAGIRWAEQAGVVVTDSPDQSDLEELVELYLHASTAPGWGRLRRDALQRLVASDRREGSQARMLVARHHGEVAAGAIAVVHKDRLSVLPSASSTAARHRGFPFLHVIEWHAIQCARAMGLRYCELHLLHRPEFGFSRDIQQRVPIHVRVSSPVLARALGVTAQARTEHGCGWTATKLLRPGARTLAGEQPPWTFV